MNEVFLIGKIVTKIDFKFIINSKVNKSIVKFKIESIDKQKISIIAYNEIADFCYRNLNRDDDVFIYGKINGTEIIIKNISFFEINLKFTNTNKIK